MRQLLFVGSVLAGGLGFTLFSGCSDTSHQVQNGSTASADGHVIGCQKCYDEVKSVRENPVKISRLARNQTIRKHKCEDCKSNVTTYTKDGVPMIKCKHCAPAGVACDKCLPPKGP